MKFAFLTFIETDGAPIEWHRTDAKDVEVAAAALAAGFGEREVAESPVGILAQDWRSFRRGARALIGDNGSTLLEVSE